VVLEQNKYIQNHAKQSNQEHDHRIFEKGYKPEICEVGIQFTT